MKHYLSLLRSKNQELNQLHLSHMMSVPSTQMMVEGEFESMRMRHQFKKKVKVKASICLIF
ncbi:hypothetical protein L873DRAFT_1859862 [Choiromyces venosus 120613-1]|uniref:Uncharacterized protein n=1 Tax=Choiromyces venosus 120613-1 TaxID=1336337 RepID=A0A3N4J2Q9_9PEZI|nr:hypothetical protein L873DRAFT_1859862 [Choiromyces venosus 120613-1]